MNEVGKTEDTLFTDMFLYANTTYTYWLSAVSIDGVESEKLSIKATTHVSTRPPLEIEVIHMHDIFSNTYKIYENEGIGTINLTNNTNYHISKLKVSFSIKEFMDFPWEIDIEDLKPFENREVAVKAVFNNKILNITEDTPVQTELKVSYYDREEIKTFSKNHTINIYALMQLGIIYAQAGVIEEAQKAFEKALEYDKVNADLKNNIGNIHFLNKHYTKAQLAYEEAANLDLEDPYILINLTRSYLKLEM